MIDWEEVIKAESTEELKEIKLWLFQENMRLEQERTELEQARNKFLDERVKLRDELDELNRRTVMERKRLKEENLFFEKKMAILQEGFRQLERIGRGSSRNGRHSRRRPENGRPGSRSLGKSALRQYSFYSGELIIRWLCGRDIGI